VPVLILDRYMINAQYMRTEVNHEPKSVC